MPDPITLATGPVTWGVDFADAPGNPPWRQVLDEIVDSALGALELGPIGYLPEDGELLRAELASRNLHAVGSFLFEDLHDPAQSPAILALAGRVCGAIASAGGTVLVVIDRPSQERAETAGRTGAARRLSEQEWSSMMEVIERIADLAAQHGLRPAIHPHAGGFIEFEDEIERALASSQVGLCLDTGHALYAGIDPASALVAYGERIAHVHLKDVDPFVLDQVRAHETDFWTAIAEGVFCPLGAGAADLRRIGAALRTIGYEGFATIEQDRVPGSGEPLEDLRTCVAALERAGIGTSPVADGASG
jgi:inosose dehydratase